MSKEALELLGQSGSEASFGPSVDTALGTVDPKNPSDLDEHLLGQEEGPCPPAPA